MKVQKLTDARSLIGDIGWRVTGPTRKQLEYNGEKGCSAWLAVISSHTMFTTLSGVEFRDEAWQHLDLPLLNTPTHCDRYEVEWSLDHTLSCPFGILVIET